MRASKADLSNDGSRDEMLPLAFIRSGLALSVLFQIFYVVRHWLRFEMSGFIVVEPTLAHRVLCGLSALLIPASFALAARSKHGWRPSTNFLVLLVLVTCLVMGTGFWGVLAASRNVRVEPWWVLIHGAGWLGNPVDSMYEPHPLIGYAPFWVVFATWVVGCLAHRGRRARVMFVVVCWVLTAALIGLRAQLRPQLFLG